MFKELIQAELKKLGLPEGLWEQITVTSEAEITAAVAKFKETYTPPQKTLAELLADAGNDETFNTEVTKLVESLVDKRVTDAVKTAEERMKKLLNPPKPGEEDTETTKQINSLTEQITKLSEGLDTQKKANEQKEFKAISAEKLKEAKLPVTWIDRVNVEKAEEIDGVIKTLTEEHTGIQQGVIDEAILTNPNPGFGGKLEKDGSTADLKKFVESKKTDSKIINTQALEGANQN